MHALEKEMATHSSVLAWRIPGTEEPGGLPSMESQSRTRLKQLSSSSPPRPRHFRLNIHQLPAQSGESAPSFCNPHPHPTLKSSLLQRRGAGQRQAAPSHRVSPRDTLPLTQGLEKSQDLMNRLLLCEIKMIARVGKRRILKWYGALSQSQW